MKQVNGVAINGELYDEERVPVSTDFPVASPIQQGSGPLGVCRNIAFTIKFQFLLPNLYHLLCCIQGTYAVPTSGPNQTRYIDMPPPGSYSGNVVYANSGNSRQPVFDYSIFFVAYF